MHRISENLYRFEDTCSVYLVRSGREAVLVDFGSGDVLDHLREVGVDRVTDVLMTHHHRDQGQGLGRAASAGIRIWVPHQEQDLFRDVDAHWQARDLYNTYNVRQDRFSLLEGVPLAGTLHDYATLRFGRHHFAVVPTPGHTIGSISLLLNVDGAKAAFTGDLIAAPGKVWSLSATQWTYGKVEGTAASIASLLDLKDRAPDMLLPSHGDIIDLPGPAIDLLVSRLRALLDSRRENPRLGEWREQPYLPVTPHVLWNRTSLSYGYVLLSEHGRALFIDYGYDFQTGMTAGADRAAHRPWLYTVSRLKRQYGVERIDAVIPTHYHDDHVAGCNLLREVERAEVWAASNFATILASPARYDLPCLWYDPIPVDRVLPLSVPIRWEEYELTLYSQPGHTRYAVAVTFSADGRRFLAAGDQYEGNGVDHWNYVYKNHFQIDDYRVCAELYRRLAPDVILPGHWEPYWVEPGYFDRLERRGAALERLHRELLPQDDGTTWEAGTTVRLHPYQVEVQAGQVFELEVELQNPLQGDTRAVARLVTPAGWQVREPELSIPLAAHLGGTIRFHIHVPNGLRVRRARVAVDLTIGGRRLGQQAEALVTVR